MKTKTLPLKLMERLETLKIPESRWRQPLGMSGTCGFVEDLPVVLKTLRWSSP